MSKTSKTIIGGVIVAPAVFAILSAAAAHADTHICIGGYTDDSGAGIDNLKAAQGYPCDETVHYSADLGLPGEVPAWQSIGEGSAEAIAAVDRHPDGLKVVEGFSEGAIVAADTGNKLMARNGGMLPADVQIIQDANGYASTGIINHPWAPVVLPFVGPIMGLPPADSIPPVPNSIHRYNEADAWGNMAPNAGRLPTEIAMLGSIPVNHELVDPNTPHINFDTPDGVHNEVYNVGTNPISEAIPQDIPVVDQFFGVVFDPTNASEQP